MKINIGAGYKKFDGYLSLDSDINCNPDVLIELDDVNLRLPFQDSTITEVRAYHILEHIGPGFKKLMQEIYRVSEPGCLIDIRVPHHNHEVFKNDFTHVRPITVEGFRLLSQSSNEEEIRRGGTSSTLGIMWGVDFELIWYTYVHDSFYDEIAKYNSLDQNERLFREALNTTIETLIKLVVVK